MQMTGGIVLYWSGVVCVCVCVGGQVTNFIILLSCWPLLVEGRAECPLCLLCIIHAQIPVCQREQREKRERGRAALYSVHTHSEKDRHTRMQTEIHKHTQSN